MSQVALTQKRQAYPQTYLRNSSSGINRKQPPFSSTAISRLHDSFALFVHLDDWEACRADLRPSVLIPLSEPASSFDWQKLVQATPRRGGKKHVVIEILIAVKTWCPGDEHPTDARIFEAVRTMLSVGFDVILVSSPKFGLNVVAKTGGVA